MNISNIFFYSDKCRSSAILRDMLKEENILDKFSEVCIEQLKHVPSSVKITPTLIINKIPVPLEADAAFQWVKNFKQLRLNYQLNKLNQTLNKDTPLEFIEREMNGFSDIFAYVAKDDAQPQSFQGYKDEQTVFTPPVPKDKTGNYIKMDDKSQKKQYDELLKKRKEQDISYKTELQRTPEKYVEYEKQTSNDKYQSMQLKEQLAKTQKESQQLFTKTSINHTKPLANNIINQQQMQYINQPKPLTNINQSQMQYINQSKPLTNINQSQMQYINQPKPLANNIINLSVNQTQEYKPINVTVCPPITQQVNVPRQINSQQLINPININQHKVNQNIFNQHFTKL